MRWLNTHSLHDPLDDETWHRRHGDNVLVAMAVNPHTVHAYWDLEPLTQRLLEDHLGLPWQGIPKVLRVCDVTWITFDGENAHWTRDSRLSESADNWYVRDLPDGRDYVCLYGVITQNGEFFALLRSNLVRTPRRVAGTEQPQYTGPKVCFQPPPASVADWHQHFTGYSLHHSGPPPCLEQREEEQPACP